MGLHSVDQPLVLVQDHQIHIPQSPCLQPAQAVPPERLGFPHQEPQNLWVSVPVDPCGQNRTAQPDPVDQRIYREKPVLLHRKILPLFGPSQLLPQLMHRVVQYTVDDGLHYRQGQRLLAARVVAEELREILAASHSGHRKNQPAYPRCRGSMNCSRCATLGAPRCARTGWLGTLLSPGPTPPSGPDCYPAKSTGGELRRLTIFEPFFRLLGHRSGPGQFFNFVLSGSPGGLQESLTKQ